MTDRRDKMPPEWVHRGPGSGSADELHDEFEQEESYDHTDKRAPTATTFTYEDIETLDVSQRRKKRLRHMKRRQEGEDDGETYYQERDNRVQQNRKEWSRRTIHTFIAQLDMTNYQKQRVKYVMDSISVNRFGRFSVEEVIMGVINVVAREDGRWVEDEEQFRALAEDVGLDLSDMRLLRRMVKAQMT